LGATSIIRIDDAGNEHLAERSRKPDIGELKTRLWNILEKEGKTLAALNAALFTNELDGRIAGKIVLARKTVAARIIRNYCLTKGLVVAVNPIPVADLLAAAGTDVAMIVHLGNVYGFQLSRREASKLLLTISAQMLLLMGAYWGVNMVSCSHENHQCRHVGGTDRRCPGHAGLVRYLCNRQCGRNLVCKG